MHNARRTRQGESETTTKHCGTFDYVKYNEKTFARVGIVLLLAVPYTVRLAGNTIMGIEINLNLGGFHVIETCSMGPCNHLVCKLDIGKLGGRVWKGNEPQFSSSLYSLWQC